jgi:GntR family transcriptional regulator
MADLAIRVDEAMSGQRDEIDRGVPIPYYYQLQELLRQQITQGRWKLGQRLPSEKELCERYGVSRTTVRQAIGNLVTDGLLHHVKGKGTFVGSRKST